MNATSSGPHSAIPVATPRERFVAELFDRLWERYRHRVSYVRDYERLLAAAGGTFVNDHIAFRTLATQDPVDGIASLSRLFVALGYRPAGVYTFDDKHLDAIHLAPPHPAFPKLFLSELRTWELSRDVQEAIGRTVREHRPAFPAELLAALSRLDDDASRREELLTAVTRAIEDLPWPVPEVADVRCVNATSQYGAWVLVHGYNVNHFTTLINSQGVPQFADLERTIAALRAAGVPMKSEIEGARGSKLRQSSTEAVVLDVPVREAGQPTTMPWTYAYFELAERGDILDPDTQRPVRFEGFLGAQATQLFEMTRR